MSDPSLLTVGRLTLDPDFRLRVGVAAQIHGHEPTEDLIRAVAHATGGSATTTETGIDTSTITDGAILTATSAHYQEAPQ